MSDILWEDPPHKGSGSYKHSSPILDFLEELAKHPGKWGIYPGRGSNPGYMRAKGVLLGLRLEVTQRGQGTADPVIYARVLEQ
jgi:hypothetical protein